MIMVLILIIGILAGMVGLSLAAFHGGFHYGHVRMLKRGRRLNAFILNRAHLNPEYLTEWNNFLEMISVEKNKASYWEWISSGWERDGNE